jgi:hypothetical protein
MADVRATPALASGNSKNTRKISALCVKHRDLENPRYRCRCGQKDTSPAYVIPALPKM